MATGTLYLRHQRTITGPFTKAQVKVMAQGGELSSKSEISVDGSPWMPVGETNLRKYLPISLAEDLKAASSFLAESSFIGLFRPARKKADSKPATLPSADIRPPPDEIDLLSAQIARKRGPGKLRLMPKPAWVSMAECFFWLALLLELASNGWRLVRMHLAGAPDVHTLTGLGALGACAVLFAVLVANLAGKRGWARFALLVFVLGEIAWAIFSLQANFGAGPAAGLLSLLPAGLNAVAMFMLFSSAADSWLAPRRTHRRR